MHAFILHIYTLVHYYFLIWVFRPTREFFSHIETSPLPVKVCKFWPILGTYAHWTVRVLKRATPTVTRSIRLSWYSSSTRTTRTYCWAFGSGLRLRDRGSKNRYFHISIIEFILYISCEKTHFSVYK